MPNELALRVSRGLDPTDYHEPLTFQLHEGSPIHHGLESCNIKQAFGEQVKISPLKVTDLCSDCWYYSLPDTPQGNLLADAFVSAEYLWDDEQLFVAAALKEPIVALERTRTLLGVDLPQYVGVPALATWLEDFQQRVLVHQDELRTQMQSTESREEIRAWCTPGQDQDVLLGVHLDWVPGVDPDATDLDISQDAWRARRIVEAWRLGQKGPWALIKVPHKAVVLLRKYLGHSVGRALTEEVALASTDTASVLETALSLWEPHSFPAELNWLENALDAARRV